MKYKISYLAMNEKTETITANTIEDIQKFAEEKGYKAFNRIDVEESLKAGWSYEMWFPNYYAKIKIEVA